MSAKPEFCALTMLVTKKGTAEKKQGGLNGGVGGGGATSKSIFKKLKLSRRSDAFSRRSRPCSWEKFVQANCLASPSVKCRQVWLEARERRARCGRREEFTVCDPREASTWGTDTVRKWPQDKRGGST